MQVLFRKIERQNAFGERPRYPVRGEIEDFPQHATQHGGTKQHDNLALACWHCNLKKGPNLAGIDPETGQIVPLFHPRKDKWAEHFAMHVGTLMPLGIEIEGLTPIGRATVRVLGMNER